MPIDFDALGTTEQEMNRMLSQAKIRLFLQKGAAFLASIMGQTEFFWDENAPTAWTNGLKIGFNPKFFLSMSKDARVTVIAHELWHIAYEHMIRLDKRDPEKWNIAADHVINIMLEKNGYKFDGLNPVKDYRYAGMGTEEVYDKLPDPPKGGGSGGGNIAGSDLSNDLRKPDKGKEIDVIAKVIQAVQSAQMSNQAGDIPGEVMLAVDKFLNPKLPWRVLLRRFFTEQSRDDYSWKRPNRRYDDEYLPSNFSEDGLTTINYYLDISGSVSDANILRFNSEVAFIKNEFDPEHLHLITFDTSIRDVYSFTRDDPFEKIIVTGRGGTDLYQVGEHIKKTKPDVAVIFSDLEVSPMQSVGGIPVIWIVVGNPRATVPFGQMVHIDDE